jgi:WD40 repeat protein
VAAAFLDEVRLWNVSDPAHPSQLGPPVSIPSYSLWEFSPDGQTLADAEDGTVVLLNLGNSARTRQRHLLAGQAGSVTELAFSPDGRTLASAGADDTVRLWVLDARRAIDRICATSRNTLTREKWDQHVPGLPFAPPCP